LASIIPFIRIGFDEGVKIQPRRDAPKRRAITNNISTRSKNANFATMLFDLKNSPVPSKYFLDEKLPKPPGPSDTLPN
jgi:hypothetical protein